MTGPTAGVPATSLISLQAPPMQLRSIEIPVLSQRVRDLGIPLSLATQVGNLIFVSGTPPFDPLTGELGSGTVEEQTHLCMKSVKHILDSAGSSLAQVAMVRIYAVNSGFYSRINAVYASYFTDHLPSRTFVPVASWPLPFDVEIECIAAL